MAQLLQVGVKILIKNKDEKYLILRRSLQKYPETEGNHFDIPGGRIEVGTPLIENLIREVKEETNLNLAKKPVSLLFAQDILSPEKHVVRLTYTGIAEGEIILDMEENDAFYWMTVSELKECLFLDQYLKEVIEKL